MAELFANSPSSTLVANIAAGDTTLTVSSAASFSAAVSGTSQFRILIDSEIMIVTNVSGTTFTVTRGQEGTTAASHTAPATVTQLLTAGALNAVTLPTGGAQGTVLQKTGSADYAASWQAPGTRGLWLPAASGLVAANFDPAIISNAAGSVGAVDGQLVTARVYLPAAVTFSNVQMLVTTAISSPTAGRTQVGVYNRAGTLLASTNISATATAWGNTGLCTLALSSSVTAGGADARDCVFIGLTTASGGSTPAFLSLILTGVFPPVAVDSLDTTYGRRFGILSGLSAGVPSSITPSTIPAPAATGLRPWFGLS